MSSSFRTLRALLVAVSSCSLAFSLSPSSSALSKRSFGDYIDNLIYLDGNNFARLVHTNGGISKVLELAEADAVDECAQK